MKLLNACYVNVNPWQQRHRIVFFDKVLESFNNSHMFQWTYFDGSTIDLKRSQCIGQQWPPYWNLYLYLCLSIRIKIGITFIFRFHSSLIKVVVFFLVGLSSFLLHPWQVLLGIEISAVARLGLLIVGVQITDWREKSVHWAVLSCGDIIEQVLGGGCLLYFDLFKSVYFS